MGLLEFLERTDSYVRRPVQERRNPLEELDDNAFVCENICWLRSGSEILISNPALIAGLEITVFDPQLYPHLRIQICFTPPVNQTEGAD